jgi:hypothetical protein
MSQGTPEGVGRAPPSARWRPGCFNAKSHARERGFAVLVGSRGALHARELALLETLPTEDRAALSRTERHSGFLAARRAVGGRLHPLPGHDRSACRPRRPLGLAALAPFGFVLEVLVGEEELFASRPDELGPAVHATQGLVLELHRSHLSHSLVPAVATRTGPLGAGDSPGMTVQCDRQPGKCSLLQLVRLAALLLACTLPRQCLLGAAPITWLQVERMLLDILDDIFLLYLPLEAAKRALDGLAFLYLDFSQA